MPTTGNTKPCFGPQLHQQTLVRGNGIKKTNSSSGTALERILKDAETIIPCQRKTDDDRITINIQITYILVVRSFIAIMTAAQLHTRGASLNINAQRPCICSASDKKTSSPVVSACSAGDRVPHI